MKADWKVIPATAGIKMLLDEDVIEENGEKAKYIEVGPDVVAWRIDVDQDGDDHATPLAIGSGYGRNVIGVLFPNSIINDIDGTTYTSLGEFVTCYSRAIGREVKCDNLAS